MERIDQKGGAVGLGKGLRKDVNANTLLFLFLASAQNIGLFFKISQILLFLRAFG
jgi:hypothetical protein